MKKPALKTVTRGALFALLALFVAAALTFAACEEPDQGDPGPGPGPGPDPEVIHVTSIEIEPESATLQAGGAPVEFTVTVYPSNATDKSVTWTKTDLASPRLTWGTRSNTGATVSATSGVSVNASGGLSITATTVDGSRTATATIIIQRPPQPTPVESVSVSPTTASLIIGATRQLTATVTPSDATTQTVAWSSSAPSVATVSSSGLVTAVSAGTATITVTTTDGSFTATCAVTVTPPVGLSGLVIWKTDGVILEGYSGSNRTEGIDSDPLVISVGAEWPLWVEKLPDNTNEEPVWSSSSPGYLTVNRTTGRVTGRVATPVPIGPAGYPFILVQSATDPTVLDRVYFKVVAKADFEIDSSEEDEGVTIDVVSGGRYDDATNTVTLLLGTSTTSDRTVTLSATVEPLGTSQKVVWSAPAGYLDINQNGTITGTSSTKLLTGTDQKITLTATSEHPEKSPATNNANATIFVRVAKPIGSFRIRFNAADNNTDGLHSTTWYVNNETSGTNAAVDVTHLYFNNRAQKGTVNLAVVVNVDGGEDGEWDGRFWTITPATDPIITVAFDNSNEFIINITAKGPGTTSFTLTNNLRGGAGVPISVTVKP